MAAAATAAFVGLEEDAELPAMPAVAPASAQTAPTALIRIMVDLCIRTPL
jgi:hypothetical protein